MSRIRFALSTVGDLDIDDGSTGRVKEIAKILCPLFDLTVISRGSGFRLKRLEISPAKMLKHISVGPSWNKFSFLKLIPIILKNRFKVVCCSGGHFDFVIFYSLSKFLGIKVIYEAHVLAYKEIGQISKIQAALFFLLEVFVAKLAHLVIALSAIAYRFYVRFNNNCFLIPVFIDTHEFSPRVEVTVGTEKVVGLVGPFNYKINEYQLDFLLANLREFNEKISFVIVGMCSKKQLARLSLCGDKVHYLGYLESRSKYVEFLRQIDALLVPVKIATFGPKNKILQAMSCGVPVFTTPEGVLALEHASSGRNIFVFKDTELVKQISELIFKNERLAEVGHNARRTVETYYSNMVNARKLLQVIKATLNSST